MAKTPSSMVPLGTFAPMFELPDVQTGKILRLADMLGEYATVICFMCNHCPYVKHIEDVLASVSRTYEAPGVSWIAINSNDVERYPDDSPLHMKELCREKGYTFPYLFDETQEVARAFGAACTPDFFVYDKNRTLAYRGQFDDSRPGNNIPVTGSSLTDTLDALLAGNAVSTAQKPSLGCNIKWKDA